MGTAFSFSNLLALINGPTEARLLMVGLDAAGKTTILYKLRFGEVVHTTPTPGFNVETIDHKNLRMTVWDLGGQEKMRRNLWRQFFMGTQGVIFVMDSSDRDRVEDAVEELQAMLRAEELREATVLVYANKQDFSTALSSDEIRNRIEISGGLGRRRWQVQPACALTGAGILEGLDWLATQLHEEQDWVAKSFENFQRQWGLQLR
eukprot:TRINITY_DN46973_c0_g1_i1.p2 TRINITY_DN46973_c0_g1~~TRINITY_DN46973_c0_g1_i1.p2  ORF type:complete len:205 (-),score=39.24 TRINITY_DN46973_c0_g1_i1:70-684(-)